MTKQWSVQVENLFEVVRSARLTGLSLKRHPSPPHLNTVQSKPRGLINIQAVLCFEPLFDKNGSIFPLYGFLKIVECFIVSW